VQRRDRFNSGTRERGSDSDRRMRAPFPVAVWSWNAALALVCGNSIVWKPSEKTPLTALATDALFGRALRRFKAEGGAAPDGLSAVLVGGREIGEALVNNPRVPWSRQPARPRWDAPSLPSSRNVSPAQF